MTLSSHRYLAPGPAGMIGESVESAAADVVANEISLSFGLLLRDEYEVYLEAIERITGKRLENPTDPIGAPSARMNRRTLRGASVPR